MVATLRSVPHGTLIYEYRAYVRDLEQLVIRKNEPHIATATNTALPMKVRQKSARRAFELHDVFARFLNLNSSIAANLAGKETMK